MVVGEEIDALRQMGVDPVRFLVVPKVAALAFAVVALGLFFDVVAIAGGALFAAAAAGIEPGAYQEQTRQALHGSDFLIALGKSAVFGGCIGVVGCALGLRVQGGSEGVGRATTNAVVLGIFLIIVIDALFVAVQRLVL
jgi:phospholipid/cholesterol/gamma-HCH transport system permease protein